MFVMIQLVVMFKDNFQQLLFVDGIECIDFVDVVGVVVVSIENQLGKQGLLVVY